MKYSDSERKQAKKYLENYITDNCVLASMWLGVITTLPEYNAVVIKSKAQAIIDHKTFRELLCIAYNLTDPLLTP